MTGFDKKVLHLKTDKSASFEVQIDFLGAGDWVKYAKHLRRGLCVSHLPSGFSAHWVRIISNTDCVASAEFMYT